MINSEPNGQNHAQRNARGSKRAPRMHAAKFLVRLSHFRPFIGAVVIFVLLIGRHVLLAPMVASGRAIRVRCASLNGSWSPAHRPQLASTLIRHKSLRRRPKRPARYSLDAGLHIVRPANFRGWQKITKDWRKRTRAETCVQFCTYLHNARKPALMAEADACRPRCSGLHGRSCRSRTVATATAR